jgi:hypothetical protein
MDENNFIGLAPELSPSFSESLLKKQKEGEKKVSHAWQG